MAAGPEISSESAVTTTVDTNLDDAHQSSQKTEVSENTNVVNSDDNGSVVNSEKGSDSDSKSDMKIQDIVDIFSNLKLNPMAEEFFPSSYSPNEFTLNYFAPAFYINSHGDGIEGYPNNRRV